MKNQIRPQTEGKLLQWLGKTRLFSVNPEQSIKSLTALSRVVMIAAIVFTVTFLYFVIRAITGGVQHFKLPLSGFEIMPLYNSKELSFYLICIYEILKLSTIAVAFYFFFKFSRSIDYSNPFHKIESKAYINSFATMSIIFFCLDVVSSIHLNYFSDLLGYGDSIRYFHWEYLLLTYFINVFAYFFRLGVNMKNELDLVI